MVLGVGIDGVVEVTGVRGVLYRMSVYANLALLASTVVTVVWVVAGRGSVVGTGEVVVRVGGVMSGIVAMISSLSVVVSSSMATVTGSSSGTFNQDSQLSSKIELESMLSSLTVGVMVAVGRECMSVVVSGKVRRPFVPQSTMSIVSLLPSGLGVDAASSLSACSSAMCGMKGWLWVLWVVSEVSRSFLTVLSTECACRGPSRGAGAGEGLGDASEWDVARGVVWKVSEVECGIVSLGRSEMRGW